MSSRGATQRPRPPDATRVVLVRHAETEAAARGRCIGRTDVGLSHEGVARAEALALELSALSPTAVYASTSRRAVATAAPIARACGLDVRPVAELCEVDFGRLEGLSLEEVEARYPSVWREWMDRPATVRFPGGESLLELSARVERALSDIGARHPRETVIVASHGGPIRLALARALGRPPETCFELAVDHLSVHVVDRPSAGVRRPSA